MKKIILSITCAFATIALTASPVYPTENVYSFKNPLIIVNGFKIRYADYAKIKPEYIESIIELSPEDAIEVFGRNGENGAIVIKLIDSFKGFSLEGAKIDELIIQKVEHYAEQAKIREQERLKAEEEAKRLASEKAEKDALEQAEKEALLAERLAQEELDRLKAEQQKANADESARKEFEETQRKEAEAQSKREADEKA
ncbi:MAG: hypothetical protein Q4G18_06855, partial [Myroides sp.]|nr:hypothetical protein [Myroides sp.]